ncbi:hypothetical protein Aduo_014496 [Ancylostoma duodenale]
MTKAVEHHYGPTKDPVTSSAGVGVAAMFSAWMRTQAAEAEAAAAATAPIDNVGSTPEAKVRIVVTDEQTTSIDRVELISDRPTGIKTDWTKKSWKNPAEQRSKRLRKEGMISVGERTMEAMENSLFFASRG